MSTPNPAAMEHTTSPQEAINTTLHLSLPSFLSTPPINHANFKIVKTKELARRVFDAYGIRALTPCSHYRPLPPTDTTDDGTRTPAEQAEMVRGYKVEVWRCVDTLYALHSALNPTPNPSLSLGASLTCQLLTAPSVIYQLWDTHARQIMAEAVYGSNYIERVGASREITQELCERVWEGEDVKAEEVERECAEYCHHLYDITNCGPAANPTAGFDDVVLSRGEIIGHARAMQHILGKMCEDGGGLTEGLIKETHRILVEGIDIPAPVNKWAPQYQGQARGVPWGEYGGKYRKCGVRAGNHVFPRSDLVPTLMAGLCSRYAADIAAAERRGSLDPVYLAAKMSLDFVQIHPFADGNGRMSRLILNAILFRYLGSVEGICGGMPRDRRRISFNFVEDGKAGEAEEKRERARGEEYEMYMRIVIRAGQRREVLEEKTKEEAKGGRGVAEARQARLEALVSAEPPAEKGEKGESHDQMKEGEWFWKVQHDDAGEFAGLVAQKCWKSMSKMRTEFKRQGLLQSEEQKEL